jgi:CubicO group peptidase (beta-lactamase class C family)
MRSSVLWLCIVCINFTAEAHADEPFLVLDGFNAFWGSRGVPDDALKRLREVQQSKAGEMKCVAFTPAGDWVIIFGPNGFYTSNGGMPVCKKLAEVQQPGRVLKSVAFAPAGGWTVLWDQNGNWTEGNVPYAASKKMQEVASQGGTLRSISYGPHGSWVILFDKTGVWYGGIAAELAQVLDNAARSRFTVLCVAFTARDWICLTDHGWWTSDPTIAPSRAVDQAYQNGQWPKWIAVKGSLGKPNLIKWSALIHRAYDGKIAGGYAFQVFQHGKLAGQGAVGWARLPSEPEDPSVRWTKDTIMSVASVSKTVSAVALLKLWEETDHKFSLDDPFWPYIKRVCPSASADVKRVTIREVLTHRSGFPKMDDARTPRDLEKLLNRPLAHPPGTFPEYQNNNYYIVHLLIEEIGHVEYTPYVKEHVLAPMGITRMETHFESTKPTCGYGRLGDRGPGAPYALDCTSYAGAVGWYASVSDLGRFLIGLRDHQVLTPATTDLLLKEGIGWDSSYPAWTKRGNWPSGEREVHSLIAHFPDDIDAVLLLNCHDPSPDGSNILVETWAQARN